MKQCSKCKQILPETDFWKLKHSKDGLRAWCKTCCYNYQKQYKNINKEKIEQHQKNYQKEYRKKNKKKMKKQQKIYYQKNKEEIKEKVKKYKEENKKKILDNAKEYYRKNKKEISKKQKTYRERHKKEIKKYLKNYCQNNKHKYIFYKNRRKTKKRLLFEKFTIKEWREKVKQTRGICPVCRKPYSEIYPYCATIDHAPPISKAPIGYIYTINDVNPMCGICNSSKSNKWGDTN